MRAEKKTSWLLWLAASFFSTGAGAREVNVIPVTDHRPLTMNTDESYGYLVLPGAPLKLELVGPGDLTLTVRLNHRQARAVFTGTLNIARNNKVLKPAELSLYRARVGSYKEDAKLALSLPKKLKVVVPAGVQKYTFTLKAPAGTSMYIGFKYESDADQSAVTRDDALALVPLTGGEEDMPPLVMPGEEKKPPEPTPPENPTLAVAPKEPEKSPPLPVEVTPSGTPPLKAAPAEKPPEKKPLQVSVISPPSPTPPESPGLEEAAPARHAPVVSLGLKFGGINPLQKVGGTTYTGSLDVRYILPLFDGRLSAGIEGGAYRYQLDVSSENRRISTLVVPISLQVYYRIPLKTFLEPFVGAGADLFYCRGDDKHLATGYQYASGAGLVFGGHLAAGLESHLGPGFLLAELRAGLSFGRPAAWQGSTNIYGVLALVGYRFLL